MRLSISVFALLMTAAAGVEVRQKPDLSGTWVATTDAPQGVAAAPSAIFGARFAIKQDTAAVVLTRMGRDGAFDVTLPLDGRELRWRAAARTCDADSERTEMIAVEGNGLAFTLVSTTPAGGGGARATNAKYLMTPSGADTITVQGTMVQQGERKAVATVYKRSAEPMPAATPLEVFKGPAADISQAAWIGATWIASQDPMTVEERWTPAASGAMLGIGRTLRGTSLASFEFLCIVERNGTLVYQAMPGGRMPATSFTLTSATPDSLTFENAANSYPKMIRYSREPDGRLKTTISAGGDVRAQWVVLKKQ
jgi:hypothetical protein